MKTMKQHFADLPVGTTFILDGKVFEKITPVVTPKRKILRGNCRNIQTNTLVKGHFSLVEVVLLGVE